MSFASALNSYCAVLGCSNRELAKRCGISDSALSRYRNGEREPNPGSDTVLKLVNGIVAIAGEKGFAEIANPVEIQRNLDTNLSAPSEAALGFGERLNSLMNAISMGNRELAFKLALDQSYISRLRNGQRQPADVEKLSSRIAAVVVERGFAMKLLENIFLLTDDIGSPRYDWQLDLYARESMDRLVEQVSEWLKGRISTAYDTTRMRLIMRRFNDFDFSHYDKGGFSPDDHVPVYGNSVSRSQFFGVDGLRQGLLEFLWRSVEAKVPRLVLVSGMSFLLSGYSEEYEKSRNQAFRTLIAQGTQIVALHDLECSLQETLDRIDLWMPLYLLGNVSAYCIPGMHSSTYTHLDYGSSACVFSADTVANRGETCRSYLSSEPEVIAVHRERILRILEMASPLMAIYREDDEPRMQQYRALIAELEGKTASVEHRWAEYPNLHVTAYPYDCVVITRDADVPVHCVVTHPLLCHSLYLMNEENGL